MPVQIICKSHKHPVKTKKAMLETKVEQILTWHARASNSKVNGAILLKFKFIWDFMTVQIICNFHKDLIKTKQNVSALKS